MPNGTIGLLQQLQGGSMRFDPLKVESDQMRGWAQKIAERAISEQDITWRTIYKKVAMSPLVFMCHSWAVQNGHFEKDIGDFINFCVKFTCDKGFGFIPAIVTGRTSIQSVVDQLRQQQETHTDAQGKIILF
jgi:hypothetical protein